MSTSPLAAIPSVQTVADGQPRFHVPPVADGAEWAEIAEAEAAGGVAAGVRAFLDAQLTGGDVLVDLAPGAGFVALSATTAPAGMPTVFVGGLDVEAFDRLQDAALDAGGWLEFLESDTTIGDQVADRLEGEARLTVHARAADAAQVFDRFAAMRMTGQLFAVCFADVTPSEWVGVADACRASGYTPCVVADREGELVVLPATQPAAGDVIALPAALFADVEHDATASGAAVAGDMPRWQPGTDGFTFVTPHARTGYGIVGASLLRALQARSQPVALVPLGSLDRTVVRDANPDAAVAAQAQIDATWPSVRLSQQFDLDEHVGTRARIGFTIFERDAFTDAEVASMNGLDALLVCSDWAREVCVAAGVTVPVFVVPLGVDRGVFDDALPSVRTSDDTVFLQVGKLEARKGQHDLLRAFEAAFTPDDAVRLVLHCHNPFVTREAQAAALAPFRASPMASRITIIDHELPTQADVAALMASADCGVFPVRAEGWNLEALEMLSLGKPIIATAYSGQMQFLTPDNARLIEIDGLEPAGGDLVGRWAAWGARQHDQLVAHLRAVHAARDAGTLGRNEAGIATASAYSWERSANALLEVIAQVANAPLTGGPLT